MMLWWLTLRSIPMFQTVPSGTDCQCQQNILSCWAGERAQRLPFALCGGAEQLKDYQLKRVTFGVASSSFAANISKDKCSKTYPLKAAVIYKSVYMDDCLTGASTIKEAVQIYSFSFRPSSMRPSFSMESLTKHQLTSEVDKTFDGSHHPSSRQTFYYRSSGS